jgi:hypothetical protein
MGVKVRIDPVDRDVKLLIDQLLSPAARSRQFAEGAQQMLDEADQTNRSVLGRIPRSRTYVDGREGAALASVKPSGGVIVREYELVIDVLVFISDMLRTISPIGRGPDKRPGHPGFYQGLAPSLPTAPEVPLKRVIPEASEYVFLSSAPYARRIEKRTTIYEMAAAKAAQRFGNIAKVTFTVRLAVAAALLCGRRRNRAERAAQRNQPAKQSAKHIERHAGARHHRDTGALIWPPTPFTTPSKPIWRPRRMWRSGRCHHRCGADLSVGKRDLHDAGRQPGQPHSVDRHGSHRGAVRPAIDRRPSPGGKPLGRNGNLWLSVFVPVGSGGSRARQLAKLLADIFRGVTLLSGNLEFLDAFIGEGMAAEEGNWFELPCVIEWRRMEA